MGALYNEPNVIAVCYASLLGTFAENNVEVFTPWDWYIGQWEVLHLFTHYTGTIAVGSTSSQNNSVSAYSSINAGKDTLSVVLVNRDVNNDLPSSVSVQNGTSTMRSVPFYRLNNLPVNKETFISKDNNALQKGNVDITNRNALNMVLPKLSVTVVQIPLDGSVGNGLIAEKNSRFYPNPAKNQLMVETNGIEGDIWITITDMSGKTALSMPIDGGSGITSIDISSLAKGVYVVTINNLTHNKKLIIE